jgi:hypothetical protein
MITFRQEGDFRHLTNFFEKSLEIVKFGKLDKYGRMGVEALKSVTPSDTGETAKGWYYKIEQRNNGVSLLFCNDHVTKEGTPIAILLQYGHATRNGGYVQGIDFINPIIVPIFEEIADSAWREINEL